MRYAIVTAFAGLVFLQSCTTKEDPSVLVDEADKALTSGGIEDSKIRAQAEQKYDRAIRLICGEDNLRCVKSGSGLAPGSDGYNLSHAHFGLAFARTFDLVERIRQLYASGTILRTQETAQVGDTTNKDTPADTARKKAEQCKQQLNLPQLVPLLKTIVDSSLLPLLNDLKAVTDYPEFLVSYDKAFLDFAFLDPKASPGDIGFEFGEDDKGEGRRERHGGRGDRDAGTLRSPA